MKKVRIGVIGLGGMGQAHITSIKSLPEAELTAVCDVNKEITEKTSEEHKVPAFSRYEELLESNLVDAVLIATPHYSHPEAGIASMSRGIHCLCEKPIAVSVGEADRLVKSAKENKVIFAVMYQQRTLPEIRLATEIIGSGRLGKIRRTCMITPTYRNQAYYDSAGWRATWKGEGGGVLINQAPHGIDLFMLLGGLPAKVTARVRTRAHRIEVEDEADALLEYSDGSFGYFYTTTNEVPSTTLMEISGDKGKLVYQDGSLRLYSSKVGISEFTFSAKEMWGAPEVTEEKLELPICETGHKEILRNFCGSILQGEKLISPGEEGLWTVEFFNALILSGKKNQPVDIPVDREAYEELLKGLQRGSQQKGAKTAQRVTDPQFSK